MKHFEQCDINAEKLHPIGKIKKMNILSNLDRNIENIDIHTFSQSLNEV